VRSADWIEAVEHHLSLAWHVAKLSKMFAIHIFKFIALSATQGMIISATVFNLD
jgi:hypothetical protein